MDTKDRLKGIPLPHEARQTQGMTVGLIVPPSQFIVPCGWEWVHTAPFEGPSIIAALVKGLGYGFKLIDQRTIFDPNDLAGKVGGFDIVGICTYEDSFVYLRKAIEIIKMENPNAPIVLGGPLVTSAPRLLMENTMADYAVIGEGELTMTELLDYLSKNGHALPVEKIDGLAWKDNGGRVVVNRQREQMESLDDVPFQDFSVWERFADRDIPEVYLSYSRGCAYGCSFCYRPMPKLRYKSIDRVRKELEYLKKRNFKMAWWNDLTFTIDHDYVQRLLDEAISVHDFRWSAFARIDSVNAEILKRMKERGCDVILYGFESITQDILNSYSKGTSKNDVVNAINLTKDAGIKVGGLFIIGAPEETKETLKNLVEFCGRFKEVTRVKYLSALPGTPLYRDAVKNGIIKDEVKHLEWLSREESIEDDIDKEGFRIFSPNVTKEDLRAVYRQINGMIEKRPYDYVEEKNVFLEEGRKFLRRNQTDRGVFH